VKPQLNVIAGIADTTQKTTTTPLVDECQDQATNSNFRMVSPIDSNGETIIEIDCGIEFTFVFSPYGSSSSSGSGSALQPTNVVTPANKTFVCKSFPKEGVKKLASKEEEQLIEEFRCPVVDEFDIFGIFKMVAIVLVPICLVVLICVIFYLKGKKGFLPHFFAS